MVTMKHRAMAAVLPLVFAALLSSGCVSNGPASANNTANKPIQGNASGCLPTAQEMGALGYAVGETEHIAYDGPDFLFAMKTFYLSDGRNISAYIYMTESPAHAMELLQNDVAAWQSTNGTQWGNYSFFSASPVGDERVYLTHAGESGMKYGLDFVRGRVKATVWLDAMGGQSGASRLYAIGKIIEDRIAAG